MSRVHRINELILRELSSILHTRFKDRTVGITFTEVSVTPDLRTARIYYAVLGDAMARHEADKLLDEIKGELRTRVFQSVTLKYTPTFSFHYDESMIRGNRMLAILDELDTKGEFKNQHREHEDESENS